MVTAHEAAPRSVVRRGREDTATLPARPAPAARAALVARSPGARRLVSTLDRLRVVGLPVLIQGETGSGKELVARLIHEESSRSARPFRIVDCGAIPPGLLEAELFGSRAGAFTGSRRDRPGLLRRGDGGTVLIDEIAGVDLEVQAKLLRVIAEGSIRPVGSEEESRIDVRFLFSTSRDLEVEVSEGRFRKDLYYRIAVVSVRVPPLRERAEDLPELVASFLARAAGGAPGESPPSLPCVEPGVIDRLRRWPWPGNVRELYNVLSRLVIEGPRRISVEDVDRALSEPTTTTMFPRNLLAQESLPALQARLERDYIVHHFQRIGGDLVALGRFLGLGRRQLYRRCERLGISLRRERRRLER